MRGIGGHFSECSDHLLPNFIVLIEDLLPGHVQIVTGFDEGQFEFGESAPGNPAVGRSLKERLSQAEVIAVFVQRRVRLRDWREQRPAETIGQQSATRRSKCDISVFGKLDTQRLPVESPIENAEAGRIYIYEDTFFFQSRKIEGQALNLFGAAIRPRGGDGGAMIAVRNDDGFLRKWRGSERKNVSAHLTLLVVGDLSKALFGDCQQLLFLTTLQYGC